MKLAEGRRATNSYDTCGDATAGSWLPKLAGMRLITKIGAWAIPGENLDYAQTFATQTEAAEHV
jgi:hypothetical protein